jgi:hypothetical protein
MRKFMGALLLGAGLLVVPANIGIAFAEDDQTVVQNQNSSENSTAQSGDASASNTAVVNSGPSANSSGVGDANAQQIGDNDTHVEQRSSSRSGDAVAGSQVTGSAGGHGGTVQNQNNSSGDTAISGNSFVANVAVLLSGPQANASGAGNSSAQQNGSNHAELVQDAVSTSGDAVAGSQVTGIV